MSGYNQDEIERLRREVAEMEALAAKKAAGDLTDEDRARIEAIKASDKIEAEAATIQVVGFIIAVVLVGGAILWWSSGSDDRQAAREAREAAREPARQLAGARYVCQEFVRQRLRAPSTADFPRELQVARRVGGDTFAVTGSVDAENAFGAKLRRTYTCRVERTGGNWQLVEIDLHE